ncbi:hypothetical protein J4573_04595 [Actinomadura barringtoniae]|uniref:AttH domain-containing protein n=1 Tax=Actinomadura barringtoniae TaxID=1427535 RepID=A0A939P791_9ACTN|nr:hypothetical protein [Actinomadura barringtoniae]MBO2446357.1 hypothetical protein [Actinomadura barringtoniae]
MVRHRKAIAVLTLVVAALASATTPRAEARTSATTSRAGAQVSAVRDDPGSGIPHTDVKRSDLTPVPGKLAEPSDDGPHPGSTTEWWYSHVMDPATHRTFIAMLFTAPVPTGVIFWYPEKGQKLVLPEPVAEVKASAGPTVTSSAGSLVYDKARGAYHLTWHGLFAKADIWFDHALPGVTGGPIRYDGDQTMYWSAPVGTSRVTGWVQPPGSSAPLNVNGWRGYHDHNWGKFSVIDQRYSGWEWGVSHEPDGTATLLGGVVKGDGTWQGVVGRVTKRETYGCMSTVKLSDWKVSGLFSYPNTTRLTCPSSLLATPQGLKGKRPGLDKTFTVVDPFILDTGLLALPESLGRTVPGSLGLIEHIRTLPPRLPHS